ncbi:MAG: TonB-dependent receptor plug domain-containing protein [Leptolyngbyaceae cyanobacterium]
MAKTISGLNLALLAISGLISIAHGVQAEQLPEVEPLTDASSALSDASQTLEDNPAVIAPSPPSPTAARQPEPATTVVEWQAQIEASLVQITGVRVEATEAGLQVVIEADGALDNPTQSVSGNALVLEIPNATLAEQFQAFEPAEGIALVQASVLPGDVVQVAITGSDAVPVVNISPEAAGLVLGVTPGIAQAGTEDDAIQLVVTGEEDGYVVPNATTGTRTDTPLRDIPQSIQVIPQALLEDQQVFRLNDALRNVSGVTPSGNDPRGPRFNLRGFNDATVLRDGFRISGTNSNLVPQDLANIEQIEVLKGPAAIVFGAVEPGGVINLVTEQPLSEPRYEFGLRLGNRGLIEPSLDFSGPITEDGRLLYRVNVLRRTESSFRDFNADIERTVIAPVVSWQVSDRTDLTVSFEYIDQRQFDGLCLQTIAGGKAFKPLTCRSKAGFFSW